jgi:K+-sensing histidine kinase KdpD
MRRNEENLLVLAGGEPARWITRPVTIADMIRAAAQEIEDYRRVDVLDTPDLAIVARIAGDIIHLLAELLDNATSFSAPDTRVTVTGRLTAGGLVVIVQDGGIGMPPARLAEANDRLSHPSALTSTLVGTMGAARRGSAGRTSRHERASGQPRGKRYDRYFDRAGPVARAGPRGRSLL